MNITMTFDRSDIEDMQTACAHVGYYWKSFEMKAEDPDAKADFKYHSDKYYRISRDLLQVLKDNPQDYKGMSRGKQNG